MGLFDWLFPTSPRDRKMCKDKTRYANEPAALQAIKRINPARSKNKPNRAYKCPRCHGYHLTRSPKL